MLFVCLIAYLSIVYIQRSRVLAVSTPTLSIMRFNAAITGALVSSATLMGQAHAEETEKKADATSLVEKPTFTVSNILSIQYSPPSLLVADDQLSISLLPSKLPSSSNLPPIGTRDGPPLTPRRRTPSRRRIGPTSVNGLSRSLPCSTAWLATRVWLSRTSRLTMPSLRSSQEDRQQGQDLGCSV